MKRYSDYLQSIFGPGKYQKLTLNAGHDCPNRDGTLSRGGCIYCSNIAFSPSYCHSGMTLSQQFKAGRHFFSRKYKNMLWLPYFQTYTSTRADLSSLRDQYMEILGHEDVAGIVVSTRPDALPQPVVELLAELPKPVIVELGAESSHDRTLDILHRGHTWQQTCDAVCRAAEAGLHVGIHLMAGLPGETDEDLLVTIDRSCQLPIETIKLHHLQILRHTLLAKMVERGEITVPQITVEHYLELCVEILRHIPDHIIVERFLAQAPPSLLISPCWNLKNYQFMQLLENRLNHH